jgi:NAD(P)-dependent dehydrogenase (short-subunit alcohol dehydrogenase family)
MARKELRSLKGTVVAISGGARGIGRSTAELLIAQGARVAIGDLDGPLVRHVADQLGAGTIGVELDVTKRASFSAFLDETERRLGPLDVLINNAGIMSLGPFEQERDEMTARLLEVNVGGTMLGCKLAMARLLPRDSGHIVNLASAAGKLGLPGGATYSASKHAVVGLSEAIRAELAGTNVEVHVVIAGPATTELGSGLRPLRGIKLLQAADVAEAIVHGLRAGTPDIYVPRRLEPLLRATPLAPRGFGYLLRRAFGGDRVLAKADPLARAAYEARIAPTELVDPAATVASAAASVADAIRGS